MNEKDIELMPCAVCRGNCATGFLIQYTRERKNEKTEGRSFVCEPCANYIYGLIRDRKEEEAHAKAPEEVQADIPANEEAGGGDS